MEQFKCFSLILAIDLQDKYITLISPVRQYRLSGWRGCPRSQQQLSKQTPEQRKSRSFQLLNCVLGSLQECCLREVSQFSLRITHQNQSVRARRGTPLKVSLKEPHPVGPRKPSAGRENAKPGRHCMGRFPKRSLSKTLDITITRTF